MTISWIDTTYKFKLRSGKQSNRPQTSKEMEAVIKSPPNQKKPKAQSQMVSTRSSKKNTNIPQTILQKKKIRKAAKFSF